MMLPASAYLEKIKSVILTEDPNSFKYPEDRTNLFGEPRKRIDIETTHSPLQYTKEEANLIESSKQFFKKGVPSVLEQDLGEIVSTVGFNKFTLGTGAIDVTYQVRKGVKYALKDTFKGYPEYQRRRAVEEIINSNLSSRELTRKFLTGESKNKGLFASIFSEIDLPFGLDESLLKEDRTLKGANILITTYRIGKKRLIKKLHGLFERVAFILLVLLTSLTIFRRLTESSFSLSYSCVEPFINAIYSALLIGFSSFLLKWVLKLMIVIQGLSNEMIIKYFAKEYGGKHIAENWHNLADKIGYMPTQVLSYLDILAQCFIYFFIAGLMLHIIIGIIISPIWSLFFVSDSLRTNSYNSFINWIKTVMVTALIPLIYTVIKLISREFNAYGYDFLEIVISIAQYLYLPAIANVILAKNSGIVQPAFNGYQIVADSINNSYNGIRSSLETHRNA